MAQLAAQGQSAPPGDTAILENPGVAAEQTLIPGLSGLSNTASATGSVITDIAVLGVAALLLWAFFSFGGARETKKLAGKGGLWFWGILAGFAVVGFYLYSQINKTATDAQTAATDFTTIL